MSGWWTGETGAGDRPDTTSAPLSHESRASVGASGELLLPEAQRWRLGLSPGAQVLVQETPQGVLLRRADPALAKVYVEPTSACNLTCRTCMRNSWDEPIGTMEMATYRRLIEGLKDVPSLRTVAFWGLGEPLLHRQIVEMVAMANALGARTEIVTNGLLLDREKAAGLMEAGLDTLVVSVDGATPEAHSDTRPGASLRLVQENVAALSASRRGPENRPEIGLEFVVMRHNVGELPGLPRLAQAMDASFVVVTNVLPYTEELKDEILYGLWAGTTYPTRRSRWAPELMLPQMDFRGETGPAVAQLLQRLGVPAPRPAVVPGAEGYCRFVGEGALAVGWDGGVSPCVALMHSYRCYVVGRPKRIRRWVVGNVAHQTISQIWQQEDYVRFRDRVQRFDFAPCAHCGGCELVDSNEEDCFGNPFPVCGDCLWAKGVIQCP